MRSSMRLRKSESDVSSGRPAASSVNRSTRVSTEVRRYMHNVFSLTISAHLSCVTVPPPSEITAVDGFREGSKTVLPLWPQRVGPIACDGRDCFRTLSKTSSSIWRKAASPSVAKISGTVRPVCCSMTSSRSIKEQQSSSESFLPTLLLPHPINPINDMIIIRSCATNYV